ncbi:hypothetical protein [Janthinobacterium fluminis]|uniref:PEP-CTERM protein-sorting domain-containing protein n=1 Tax=Janthinobacterium fluminis TaxID=2987524 RepID=A0ABT5K739_9BURK|nr:hypothetical protein [Janthinobacterium fluminis]MDC8760820.1 hypothetical protein [Janthinobacterium fluminis]
MQLDGKRVLAAALMAAAAGGAQAATAASAPGAARAEARPPRAAAPARPQSGTPLDEPSPYAMLLMGVGVMVLAGHRSKQAAPWAPSAVK